MQPTRLPTVESGFQAGHEHAHAALKVDYDSRHPDALLPALGKGLIGGRDSHVVIHELLAADLNAVVGGELKTEISAWTVGHLGAHNTLHAAYNARLAG